MPIIRAPLTEAQKEILKNKEKPSAEDVQRAQDDLFMNLLTRVAELEAKKS